MTNGRITLNDMLSEVSECLLSAEVSEEFHAARGDKPYAKMERRIAVLKALRDTLRIVEPVEDDFRVYCQRIVTARRRERQHG
ncbi:hypothetical protein [Pelagibacterium lacus]|uniref:Uncharacterized protein n=1 Tax=Pelagibacterium lacus TaxID=2282655 RepID=A0A369W1F6_9HYPH|nr:hypothetical protein [Pelagibacterium lacus]RDE07715.1 hypothetical protein DVH29_15200 [Pelagibacterium lacus]